MTQCSLHRRSLANTITDVTAYASLSLALLSFLSHPSISLSLLFSFTFLLLPFISLSASLIAKPFSFLPPLLSFPHRAVSASLSAYLFLFLPQPLYVVSSLSPSVCHSSVLKVHVADWLSFSSVCLPERKESCVFAIRDAVSLTVRLIVQRTVSRRHADIHTHTHMHTQRQKHCDWVITRKI